MEAKLIPHFTTGPVRGSVQRHPDPISSDSCVRACVRSLDGEPRRARSTGRQPATQSHYPAPPAGENVSG